MIVVSRFRLGLTTVLTIMILLCVILYIFILNQIATTKDSEERALGKKVGCIDSIMENIQVPNIRKISASLNDLRETMGLPDPPIPEFEIDVKYHPIIFKAIFPAQRHEYPASWDNNILGHITITTKMGDVVHAFYCFAGQNPLCFSVEGVRYMRSGPRKPFQIGRRDEYYTDEGAMLYNIIREINIEQTTNLKSKRLSELVDELEKTIGDKPPERSQDEK
jgi:hypothetical protein